MNLFYKSLIRKWAEPTGDWEQDVENSAKVLFDHLVAYPGISAYLVLNHRFRVFQLTAFGDQDYGAEVLDQFVGHVRAAGLSESALGSTPNSSMRFVINTAHQATHDLLPADHRQFLEDKLASLDPRRTQNIVYGKVGPLQLNADSLFKEDFHVPPGHPARSRDRGRGRPGNTRLGQAETLSEIDASNGSTARHAFPGLTVHV
ncbi:MAG: hypothetical protein IPP45_11265 [Sphingomonadales bacterium]|nr:hypothetical protein [Sphingomonadales bacterium]